MRGGCGRARAALAAGLIAASALAAAGCGESRHPNEQRPQVSTRVSVTVTVHHLIVQPKRIAHGQEETQQMAQNQKQQQAPVKSKAPLDVTFVVANQTSRDLTLTVRGAGTEVESTRIFANSPETFGAELPTGSYTVSADGLQPARLSVGRYRASSQNDVLLP